MARPAIIIGLGGTGQWVLTFLKKELQEVGGGIMPPGVKLLSFDTTSTTTAITGKASKNIQEENIRAGAVELTPGTEFIPIGDNVLSLASEISQGKYPHLQWFPAASLIGKLPASAFNTKEGSGQIRQMGRMTIFRDLSAPANSKILSHLRAAIQGIRSDVSADKQLEIIIVGSLAGGTGAGMLVDMALLVRAQAAQLVQRNYIVRGFFVLPRAFTRGGLTEDRDMLARAFATWRELDRFMIVSERFGVRTMHYHPQHQDLRIKVDKRAYDVSYMVDPARSTGESLDNTKADEGLYPALAHCLSAIIDDKAGQAYTEFVATNLAGKLAQLPRRPYHSAIGSYTLKVPVFYAQQKFSHQLALDVLQKFLAPEFSERDKNRVVRLSERSNAEVADGFAGKQAVLAFMGMSSLNIAGNDIPNTLFLPLVADVRLKEAQREASMIRQWATGGLTHEQGRVMLAMTNISQDEAGKLIQRNITDELRMPIWKAVAPSQDAGDTPAQAFSRIKNGIAKFYPEHYGIETTGQPMRGTYGKALEQAKIAQIARFKKLLQAWTVHALNGQSEDPLVARAGKLGYIRTFYEELIHTFIYFVGFLDKVQEERNQVLKLKTQAEQAANQALNTYSRDKDKKSVFAFFSDFTHPDALESERNYLQAEQRRANVRKDSILLEVLAETAVVMRTIAEQLRDEVDNWIAHLGTGDPGLNIDSLYYAAASSLANIGVNHALDKRLSKISQLVGEHEYKLEPAYLSESLARLVWQAELTEQGFRLVCGVSLPTDNLQQPNRYEPFSRSSERAAQYNLDLLLKLAERRYQTLQQERPLAKEVAKVYITGDKLATAIDKKAEPFYATAITPQGPQVVACYIRVDSTLNDQTTAYFQLFKENLASLNPNIKNLELVPSEDSHKLTIVRSDDILPSTDFEMWHACQKAYVQQITDPYRDMKAAELHIFPAEINACQYEAEMPGLLGKNYRTLHPEVVALLEDRERIEMFFRAYSLGFVRSTVDEITDAPYWIYKLPDHAEPLFITIPKAGLAGIQPDDIFQVIHNFVMEGSDRRPGFEKTRRIEWDRLRDAILAEQRKLGKTETANLYRQEINGSKGMVQYIKKDVEQRRRAVEEESLRAAIGQEHEDLADLAKVIYLKAIESLR